MEIENREAEFSDLELLASALSDALVARQAGVVIGPDVDVVVWRRSVERALHADLSLSDVDGAA